MIQFLAKRRRAVSYFLLISFTLQLVPFDALSLTGGPSQPEVQGFKPVGASDMVDLFTGDFSYNIPLFELPGPNGGYPFNLSYQSGVGMDQEASWVGLGWSLNPGAINRQMRGIPDEFRGDLIKTKMSIDPNTTVGLGAGASVEVFGSDALSLNVGFSVYNNSYKGFGYSIDGSIGFAAAAGDHASVGAALGLSLDSQEGAQVSPSLSLGTKLGEFGLGVGYNATSGTSSFSITHSYTFEKAIRVGADNGATKYEPTGKSSKSARTISASASLSLSHPGYTPQITMPMTSSNISATFKAGGAVWGIFGSPYVTGFYNDSRLKNDKKSIPTKAFGYLNYQFVDSPLAMLDFNREKDGIISKEIPNLPIPTLSYDIYSVVGQGIGAMYRPMRTDYGSVYDQDNLSESTGGSAGIDIAPTVHVGVNLSVNHAKSTSGKWSDNSFFNAMKFDSAKTDQLEQPVFFKVHGEPSIESAEVVDLIGGDKAVRPKLEGSNVNPELQNHIETASRTSPWDHALSAPDKSRKNRNQVIQPITNAQLLKNNEPLISHFKVNFIDESGQERPYERSWPKHHHAGFTALTGEGLQYIYAIPAYNTRHEEVTFSAKKPANNSRRASVDKNASSGDPVYNHNDTDKFLKSVEIPAYAHSYLLTSIIGPDYVDVTNDGVSIDDLGYWVKFTYQRLHDGDDPYKWRDPFSKAHYNEGWKTDQRDDKGSFVYGEKEIWYLAKAETKSHIAKFTTKARSDSRGVQHKLQDDVLVGKELRALDNIVLFTRAAGENVPLKIIELTHNNSLCNGIENGAEGGKLTLESLRIKHGLSERGALNPYEFEYSTSNPSYDINSYDRWGNYKPHPETDQAFNHDFPYTNQDPAKKSEIDSLASSWSLRQIKMPSGGVIIVDYESDDYAYVQHKRAMQMVEVVDPYSVPSLAQSSSKIAVNDDPRIRFKLETPIPDVGTINQRNEVLKYIDQQRKQIYFKVLMNLRTTSENNSEYISGYADINMTAPMVLEKESAQGDFVYGSFYLAKEKGYHPFSLRSWQHLRTNQPQLANKPNKITRTNNTKDRVNQIKSLLPMVATLRKFFTGFYKNCSIKKWSREITAGKSWIRLQSPDGIKYGGGLRVKQITMKDQWNQNEEGIYGQVYEYTTVENKRTISSGVASYEPLVGGDENPLRYGKKYPQSVPLRSDNNLFFEYPINETYYPGANVGYRKVTVMSLAAAALAGKDLENITLSDGASLFPKGSSVSFGTTGMTVHDFFTAKEFPVITDETEKKNKPYKLAFPIPFIGNKSTVKLAATQGYSIVTNDMHGKPAMVSNYRQDKSGKIEPEPISWVKYNYAYDERFYEQEKVFVLRNRFKQNPDGSLSLAQSSESASTPLFTIGQETEFFSDVRQYKDEAWTGGVRLNVDILFFLIAAVPIPLPWPSIINSKSQLQSAVTNKVIFKSGILESTEAYDGGSTVKTNNLKWDATTGATVLTSVNNNFDAPIYSYSIPAYAKYQGMGAAFQNIGLMLSLTNVQPVINKSKYYQFSSPMMDKLYPGDEILLYPSTGAWQNPIAKVVFTGDVDELKTIYTEAMLAPQSYRGVIVRSGFRNQLSIQAGSITSLQDPSLQGEPVVYQKSFTIPQ